MQRAPKIIIAIVALIFVGWGGYWLVGSQGTQRVIAGWFDDRRAEGWTAEYSSLKTAGFPSRFDTTIQDLSLADPETGVAWSAPLFQSLSLSYQPTDVIVVVSGEQSFATRQTRHQIDSEDFRASVSLKPTPDLPVDNSVLVIDQALITSDTGEETGLGHAQISMRETPGRTGHVYDFDLQATGLRPDTAFVEKVSRAGGLPAAMQEVMARATIRFDNPWDRFAIERSRPQPREIELTSLAAKWGALELNASGVLVVDDLGQPEGELAVKAQNWRDMIEIAEASGALDPSLVGIVTRAAEMIARMSGDEETLDATLTFKNGRATLGPIPIGPAPLIVLP